MHISWELAEWGVETGTEPGEETGESVQPGAAQTQPPRKKLPIRTLTQSAEKKPCLIYFFFPPDKDKKDPRGKRTALFENRALDNEEVARISKYFNCYRLDVSGIDEKSLVVNGITTVPTLFVTDFEFAILGMTSDHKLSAVRLLAMLTSIMQKKLPDVWKQFSGDRKKAEALFNEGTQLMRQKKYPEALEKFEAIIQTPAATLKLVKKAATHAEAIKAKLKIKTED